jgi:DNA (cytosine-5)-methyltransferase 1
MAQAYQRRPARLRSTAVAGVKPRLLDLFCGAGGAAMGYHRAGFEVVGVDINPQPHYPFEFYQDDALHVLLAVLENAWAPASPPFSAIHASPPCQAYSIMRNLPWLKGREYWDSIPPTRALLETTNVPWVIENVKGAPLDGIFLCGTMFGLRQPDGGPEYRHRVFETSFFLLAPGHPKHYETVVPGPYLKDRQNRMSGIGGTPWKGTGIDRSIAKGAVERWGQAMGIDWMNRAELSQAIPPAYTEWIGRHLLAAIERAA